MVPWPRIVWLWNHKENSTVGRMCQGKASYIVVARKGGGTNGGGWEAGREGERKDKIYLSRARPILATSPTSKSFHHLPIVVEIGDKNLQHMGFWETFQVQTVSPIKISKWLASIISYERNKKNLDKLSLHTY